jgi:hypothetical protein
MLQEVRFFAAIKDTHILRYNHSWIELTYKKPQQSQAPLENKKVILPILANNQVTLVSPYIEFADETNEADEESSDDDELVENETNSAGNQKNNGVKGNDEGKNYYIEK